jgi:hypothetical protein
MDWMETEFKALSEVISGASDFVAAFSVESILKILHDFDCADLEKFREKISQFPSATSTSIIRASTNLRWKFCFLNSPYIRLSIPFS